MLGFGNAYARNKDNNEEEQRRPNLRQNLISTHTEESSNKQNISNEEVIATTNTWNKNRNIQNLNQRHPGRLKFENNYARSKNSNNSHISEEIKTQTSKQSEVQNEVKLVTEKLVKAKNKEEKIDLRKEKEIYKQHQTEIRNKEIQGYPKVKPNHQSISMYIKYILDNPPTNPSTGEKM